MGFAIQETKTNITTDYTSEWIYIPSGDIGKSEREECFAIQGYYEGADTGGASADLYFTLDTTLAETKGMENNYSGTAVTLGTSGSFAFGIDNHKWNACRLKVVLNSVTTLATLVICRSWE